MFSRKMLNIQGTKERNREARTPLRSKTDSLSVRERG